MIVGVLGGGQLARMLALAGLPLGLEFMFLSPEEDACAASLGEHLCAPYDDSEALAELVERSGIVTYEFENLPLESVRWLSERMRVLPPVAALSVAQDRLEEKTLFRRLGIDTPEFAAVDSLRDLKAAADAIGYPALLKTRRMGYDGKGQALLRGADDLQPAWDRLGGQSAIVEAFVSFDREISVLAVRGREGETVFYPLSENTHRHGILRVSCSRPGDPRQSQAEAAVQGLLDALDYTGVMALELFQVGDRLLANEFAPRVHNSGHWTIEGSECSQFENHLRALLGWPLGSVARAGRSGMVNFIGSVPRTDDVLAVPGAHLHVYGKSARPGRKIGHATVRSDEAQELTGALDRLQALAEAADLG